MEKGTKIVALKSYMPNKLEVYAHGTYLGIDPKTNEEMISLDVMMDEGLVTMIFKTSAFEHLVTEKVYNELKASLKEDEVTENHLSEYIKEQLQ